MQGFFNNNKLRFHDRKGAMIKLSNNNRTCERRRPYDEFNNGVVMTHRPLRDNELLEIRIDRLVYSLTLAKTLQTIREIDGFILCLQQFDKTVNIKRMQ